MRRPIKTMKTNGILGIWMAFLIPGMQGLYAQGTNPSELNLKISFGHSSKQKTERFVQLKPASSTIRLSEIRGVKTEGNDQVGEISKLVCGSGDVDELSTRVSWTQPEAASLKKAEHHDGYSVKGDGMWGYLMENGNPGQAARLMQDQWHQPDAPAFTVQLNEEGTEGFSVALANLLQHGSMWLPEHDVFITIDGKGAGFKKHLASLKGQRTVNLVQKSPDASFEQFRKRWADFGNPNDWDVSWETKYMGTKGHLTVTAAKHGSIYKYAVDRFANVRPDFASPHRFRLDLVLDNRQWKGQRIENGLPIVITNLNSNNHQFEVEQFVSILGDTSTAVRGYVPSLMFSKIKVSGKGAVNFGIRFNNERADRNLIASEKNGVWTITDNYSGETLLAIEAKGFRLNPDLNGKVEKGQQISFNISGDLKENEEKNLIVKLPSPAISGAALATLNKEQYQSAMEITDNYWEKWIAGGAHFSVPEKRVNDLYRASLWHSLILPRHTINDNSKEHMDLPYANTAYGQKNSDWPINQAVYVDYMIYGLRGYDKVATEELKAMYQSQLKPDGRVSGFANWGVYSPGHLYTIAQNYLLSANKESFELLLPESLKTLDFLLAQIARSDSQTNRSGLILGALNDLTHAEREWAFTQAYYVAGLELFGTALKKHGHPRASETLAVAAKMKQDVVRAFASASVKSAVVQVGDGTWVNYVPTDAMTPRRMMEQWYPTDVDCGPLHLTRLGVFDPNGWMTTAMLHDHEDNLFLNNDGAANEPVYVQQGNAYLLRDDAKNTIRSFYSMLACAFSHEQLTSLEHRWAWGQYYGPPSTDGAWFELYRRMLINEVGNDTLRIGQAIPREWLKSGQKIEVKDAPTNFGPLSLRYESEGSNQIKAELDLPQRNPPAQLIVRFRHPQQKPIRAVTVNGKRWTGFDLAKEEVRIPNPTEKTYTVIAAY